MGRFRGFMRGSLWGLLIGGGLALLMAPRAGEETRRRLRETLTRLRDDLRRIAEEERRRLEEELRRYQGRA